MLTSKRLIVDADLCFATLQVSRDSQTNKAIPSQTKDKWATFTEENYKELRSHFKSVIREIYHYVFLKKIDDGEAEISEEIERCRR